MAKTMISVENLSKVYRMGTIGSGSLRDDFAIWWANLHGKENPLLRVGESAERLEGEYFWALRDINLEVKEGEIFGIIGENGAGKSTLLKILSRITSPTEGEFHLGGRLSSLIEVGTGFHGELTGRENIYLNGAIHGMKRNEIDRRLEEIIDFAGVGEYIDTPIKRYSSGMYVRLGFAVAAHLNSEILLVDEVLAVGDIAFQKKALGKLKNVAGEGRTVLFVSHNMATVENICTQVILIHNGKDTLEGSAKNVIQEYRNMLLTNINAGLKDRTDNRFGTGKLRFTKVELLGEDGNLVDQVPSGKDCILSMTYESTEDASLSGVTFGASFYSKSVHLFSLNMKFTGDIYDHLPPAGKVLCKIPRLPVSPGSYQYNIICRVRGEIADWVVNAGELIVSEGDYFGSGQLPGRGHSGVLVDHSWSINSL